MTDFFQNLNKFSIGVTEIFPLRQQKIFKNLNKFSVGVTESSNILLSITTTEKILNRVSIPNKPENFQKPLKKFISNENLEEKEN